MDVMVCDHHQQNVICIELLILLAIIVVKIEMNNIRY